MRTGIDLVEAARIAKLIQRYGESFLSRHFSDEERAECENKVNRTLHYAGKFAAKEAVYKTLHLSWSRGFSWRDIEIIHNREGFPEVRLNGRFHEFARQYLFDVSVSHAGEYATAVALAQARES